MAVFPESMGRIDVDDPRGAIRVIDSYIRYMQERIEFANRQTTRTVTEAGITSVGFYEDLVTLRTTVQALASTINAALAAIAQDQLAISALDDEVEGLGGRVDSLEEQYSRMSASVTQTESGATVTITDKDGTTTSADIADGVTPDISIGTVETLPAGSDATASITGTAEEPLLNLGIPKGADGSAAQLLQAVYPVGSLYLSTTAANPATLFGFGTWVQVKDTFLLAAGDTYAAGTTGGEATHTLTVNELPDHKHYIAAVSSGLYDIPAWTMQLNKGTYTVSSEAQEDIGCGYSVGVVADPVGLAHNNMPPYLAVYVWQRTA